MKKSDLLPEYKYNEYAPPKKLAVHVEKIWVFESAAKTGNDIRFHLIPDYTSSLILIITSNTALPRFFITGPNTLNYPLENSPCQLTIGYRFKPLHINQLFGTQPTKIINSSVNLKEIVQPSELSGFFKKISASRTILTRMSAINNFILKFTKKGILPLDEINTAIDLIISSEGKIKLEGIYRDLKISPRQFQRKFTKQTGLAPKEFCKLVRFHMVTRKLVRNNFRHFDTLVESGYYDQSHYYREFKEFLGMLPTRFEKRQKKISHEKLLG